MKSSVDRYFCVAKKVSMVQLKCPTDSEIAVYVVSWMWVLLNCSTQQAGCMLCWVWQLGLLHHTCPKLFRCICFPKHSSFWKDFYSCGALPGLISPLRTWELITIYCRTQLESGSILDLSVAIYIDMKTAKEMLGVAEMKREEKLYFFVR